MVTPELIHKLSLLARVRVPEESVQARIADFNAILQCIDELNEISIPADFRVQHAVVNHARIDVVTPASSDTVARMVEAFPDRQMDYLRVSQVLNKN